MWGWGGQLTFAFLFPVICVILNCRAVQSSSRFCHFLLQNACFRERPLDCFWSVSNHLAKPPRNPLTLLACHCRHFSMARPLCASSEMWPLAVPHNPESFTSTVAWHQWIVPDFSGRAISRSRFGYIPAAWFIYCVYTLDLKDCCLPKWQKIIWYSFYLCIACRVLKM